MEEEKVSMSRNQVVFNRVIGDLFFKTKNNSIWLEMFMTKPQGLQCKKN